MSNDKVVILIDGHSLAYRSYFALERTGMRNSSNMPTWAVYGFFKAFFDLISKVKPDAIAVSFDVSRRTFRTEKYEDYKAHRPPMPDAMREQVHLIRKGIEALNIPIYEQEGFEADDIIGTLATKITEDGHKTMILTGDQDSFQLLDNEQIRVLLPIKGELVEFDRNKVFEKLGVHPEQLTDYKGLCGDSSDNIPGIKGIGEKSAVTLLKEFNTLDNIYDNLEKISKKRLKTLLEEGKDQALLSKDLATICRDMDLKFDFKCCSLEIPDLKEFREFLKDMEFRTFLRQLPDLFKNFVNFEDFDFTVKDDKSEVKQLVLVPFMQSEHAEELPQEQDTSTSEEEPGHYITVDESGQTRFSFTTPVQSDNPIVESLIINDINLLETLITKLNKAPVFAIDLETNSLNVMEASIVGIALSWQDKVTLDVKDNKLKVTKNSFYCNSAYIPVGHKLADQLPLEQIMSRLKPILEGNNKPKILHNAKYDIHVLMNYDIELNNVIFDTMLASYVDDSSERHGLKELAMRKFHYVMEEYTDIAGKGKNQVTLDNVDVDVVAKYASMDSAMTLKLAHYYANKLTSDQQELLYNMEMPLIKILVDMERTGIGLDTAYLKQFSKELSGSIGELEEKIYKLAKYSERFNLNSPKQLGIVLFDHMGIPAGPKTKTKAGFSTSAKVLENLAQKYEIAKLLLEHRQLTKLKTTYVDALPKLVNNKTNKIHTTFNQVVTTTGRLSSSDPNLQNIPIRTEIGNRMRKAFIPGDRENSCLFSADYSQIELRFLADICQEPNLVEAFKANKDIHTDTACRVFGISPDKVTKEMRRQAKAVNFGIIYGQTPFGLSESIGISPKEAKEFISKYFHTYPKVKEYMDLTIQKAHQYGYVTTKFGRKRYLDNDLKSSNRTIKEFAERAAINSPLQGSAADLIKLAMIDLYNKINSLNLKTKMLLQVHDELVLEVPKEELETIKDIAKNSMENVYQLSIPLVVDISTGKDWMEAK